jgi:D-glycero-alpha-D-manno-heptose 1-phosphate guanylyltransferase
MERQAVILAGGLGTRLRGVIDDLPKSMAPVAGKPFLSYILEQLSAASFARVILAVGYKNESIISFFGSSYKNLKLEYSVEDLPLGTGGALLKASAGITEDHFFVINGDTIFSADLVEMEKFFFATSCDIALAIRKMKDFYRYGTVTLEGVRIKSFNEKKPCREGFINAGIYIVNRNWVIKNSPVSPFSFERDLMEKRVTEDIINGFASEAYFIDIGVPDDYEKAKRELPLIIKDIPG